MARTLLALAGFFLIFLAQLFTLQHCATPTSPNGGPRDSIGPILILEKTTPNFQTNFRPEEIVLTFDEWVKQNPKQEILISPPLELKEGNQPYLRKKSLVIPLQGLTLRDSVTYVVNIGSAIEDLNEGNPTSNLRFVFATGPVLDSAMVSGTLVEDFSGKPIDKATFTLFGNLADTATTTENPTYFAQTDEEGKFTVFNVRPGRYRAVALIRNPGSTNYYVDLGGTFKPKSVGFIDTIVSVNDGSNELGTVRLSPLPIPTKVIGVDTTSLGQINLTLNQAAEKVDYRSGRSDYLRYNDADTLRLFYQTAAVDTILIGRDDAFPDTLIINGQPGRVGRAPQLVRGPAGKAGVGDGPTFVFSLPLAEVDTSLIDLLRDTFPGRLPVTYRLDSLYPGALTLLAPWNAKSRYQLVILPGALTALNGATNTDTIQRKLLFASLESLGILRLKLTDLNPTFNYILRLTKDEKPLVYTRRYIQQRFAYDAEYRDMPPGNYAVELIYDSNRNQRYDAGDYRFLRQPEVVRRFTIEALRANWEVEKEISLAEEK
jgi:hypothetical protein